MNTSDKKRKKAIKDAQKKMTLFAAMCVSMLALAFFVLLCEQNQPNTTITNYPDAVWYIFSSATTIGFGDMVATTGGGKFFTFFAYIFSRIVVIAMIMSSFNNLFGRKGVEELTAEDRLVMIENEFKQIRSSLTSLSKDIHVTVKDHNGKRTKHSKYVANSITSLKDFMGSEASRGAEVVANFTEDFVKDNFPEDYQVICALCDEKRVFSLQYAQSEQC